MRLERRINVDAPELLWRTGVGMMVVGSVLMIGSIQAADQHWDNVRRGKYRQDIEETQTIVGQEDQIAQKTSEQQRAQNRIYRNLALPGMTLAFGGDAIGLSAAGLALARLSKKR